MGHKFGTSHYMLCLEVAISLAAERGFRIQFVSLGIAHAMPQSSKRWLRRVTAKEVKMFVARIAQIQ